MSSLVKAMKSTVKPPFSHPKANIIVSGYIRNIGIKKSIIPKEIDTLCFEYYYCVMPEFNHFNCTIDHKTGLIRFESSKNAYLITKEQCFNNYIHRFKFEYGPEQWSPAVGLLPKSKFDQTDDVYAEIGRHGPINSHGCVSWVATIEIVLNLMEFTIAFNRLEQDLSVKTWASYDLKKAEEYYFIVRFNEWDNAATEIQFLEWTAEMQ